MFSWSHHPNHTIFYKNECGKFCPCCSGHCYHEVGHFGVHICDVCGCKWGDPTESVDNECGKSCPNCSDYCHLEKGHIGPHTCNYCGKEW